MDIIGVIFVNLDLTPDIIDAKKAIPLAEIVLKVTVSFLRVTVYKELQSN